jgi:hypothetical protein
MKFEFLDGTLDDCPPDVQPTFFGFECPKRADGYMCGDFVLRGNPEGYKPANRTWEWNGDRAAPTFSPSINCGGCAHGFIENGKWRDA